MVFIKGDFAQLNGRVCVIVGIEGDPNVPEGHVAAWFGERGESGPPEAWTVPAEYFLPLDAPPIYCH